MVLSIATGYLSDIVEESCNAGEHADGHPADEAAQLQRRQGQPLPEPHPLVRAIVPSQSALLILKPHVLATQAQI